MLRFLFIILFALTILFFRNELIAGIVYFSDGVNTSVKSFVQGLCDEGEEDACPGNKKPTQPDDNFIVPNPDFVPLPLPNHSYEKDRSYIPLPNHSYEKDKPYIPSDIQSHQPPTPSNPSFSEELSAPNVLPSAPEPSPSVTPDCEVEGWAQFQAGIQKGVLPCKPKER